MSASDVTELAQSHVSALEKALAESIAIDKAWSRGELSQWIAENLEAEREAFYGDDNGNTGTDSPA
jgi:hypothetical protein